MVRASLHDITNSGLTACALVWTLLIPLSFATEHPSSKRAQARFNSGVPLKRIIRPSPSPVNFILPGDRRLPIVADDLHEA
jgi:hypothetical protein